MAERDHPRRHPGVATGGRRRAGHHRRRRRPGAPALPRILHGDHPQPEHARRVRARHARFFDWCEAHGIRDLDTIEPLMVATYIEQLTADARRPP